MNGSPAKYRKQHQDARDSRTLHFHCQYLKSSVKLLTASIRVDWFSLQKEKFWTGRGFFKPKHPHHGLAISRRAFKSPCACRTKEISIHGIRRFALPIAWPDITDIDPHYFKKTSAYQLLSLRMQMGVTHM